MTLFGGILPFAGFRKLSDDDCRQLALACSSGGYWQSFDIEWLHLGVTVWVRWTSERDDLDAARGVVIARVVSLCLWGAVALAWLLW